MAGAMRKAAWATGGVVALAGSTALAVHRSPRWVAAVVRVAFERAGEAVAVRMRDHVPAGVTTTQHRVPYLAGSPDTTLTLHRPVDALGVLPVLVWIHGGAWISGNSTNVDPYLRILAGRVDVAAVSVDYSPGPRAPYPVAVRQIQDALRYLVAHADELRLDVDRVVLAGDSAGAQLAAETAALITRPDFAADAGISPALPARQVRGIILHCGVYDPAALARAPGLIGWTVRQVLWAYTGIRSSTDNSAFTRMNSAAAVTVDFPPTLITGGNADPLTAHQSRPFADHLRGLGVPTQSVFFPDDHRPALGHEFQFDLANSDAQAVLDQTVAFLRRRLGTGD